jgi:hypothetical protein
MVGVGMAQYDRVDLVGGKGKVPAGQAGFMPEDAAEAAVEEDFSTGSLH